MVETAVRAELVRALRSLSLDDLAQARRYINGLLARLAQRPGLKRGAPPGVPERRRYGRYSCNLAATYVRHRPGADEDASATPVQQAVVRDLSQGGARFFTAEPLEPSDVLTIYLPSPMGVRKLFVEVVRVEHRGTQYECGAAFVGLERVEAARAAEAERSKAVQVLVVCEPSAEREVLTELLVKQGYAVHMANSVPEGCTALALRRCAIAVATAPLLLAEGGRLLRALGSRRGDVLSIAVLSTSDLDGPQGRRLRACHDFITEPDKAQEVRVVLGRTYRRLMALRAQQAGQLAP